MTNFTKIINKGGKFVGHKDSCRTFQVEDMMDTQYSKNKLVGHFQVEDMMDTQYSKNNL